MDAITVTITTLKELQRIYIATLCLCLYIFQIVALVIDVRNPLEETT